MYVCFSQNNEWLILQVSSSMPQQKKHCNKNPFPPAEDFKLLPLILLVSACSSSTRERGEKPNQKVTITKGGREGPKSNIPSISTMGFSTLILSKAMAASKDDNEDNSCSRRSNKGLTKELTNSEREIERSRDPGRAKARRRILFQYVNGKLKTHRNRCRQSSPISRTGDQEKGRSKEEEEEEEEEECERAVAKLTLYIHSGTVTNK
jgi:hypothetical protein